MAEILLSLTIIGVVAAITLPALSGNINERIWNTQHKALYARISQAIPLIPALNSYQNTESFVTGALSKVLKINNICDGEHLKDCGLPKNFTTLNGNKNTWPTHWRHFEESTHATGIPNISAAFETANGESIAVYNNQTCTSQQKKDWSNTYYDSFANICTIFLYDLNGKKGPNTMWKDIGVITVFYPTDSIAVAPKTNIPTDKNYILFKDAASFCHQQDEQTRMSNLHETMAIGYYSRGLLGLPAYVSWASTQKYNSQVNKLDILNTSSGYWWVTGDYYDIDTTAYKDTRKRYVWCVKR